MECFKCSGIGILQGFAHVAGGKCFECGGTGTVILKTSSMTYAKTVCYSYQQSGFFYPTEETKKIQCIAFEGSDTGEKWVMSDSECYYIGQPVCHASGWYKVPASEWDGFKKLYNKAFKTNIN